MPEWSPRFPARRLGEYAPIPNASGVYVIFARRGGRALYVGESHTGRMRRTALRHFSSWISDWTHPQPRQVYKPEACDLAWQLVAGGPRAVKAAERAAMLRFEPRDNYLVPRELLEEPEEVDDVAPF